MKNNLSELQKLADLAVNGKTVFASEIKDAATNIKDPSLQAQVGAIQSFCDNRIKRAGLLATVSQKEFDDFLNSSSLFNDKIKYKLASFSFEKERLDNQNKEVIKEASNRASAHETQELYDVDYELKNKFYSAFDNDKIPTSKAALASAEKDIIDCFKGLNLKNVDTVNYQENGHFGSFTVRVATKLGNTDFEVPVKIASPYQVDFLHGFFDGNTLSELNPERVYNYFKKATLNTPLHQPIKTALATLNKNYILAEGGEPTQEVIGHISFANTGLYADTTSFDKKASEPLRQEAAIMSKELEAETENIWKNAIAECGSSFNRNVIANAKAALGREFRAIGIDAKDFIIEDEKDNSLILTANARTPDGLKKVSASMEIIRDVPLIPTHFFSGANIFELNKSGASKFASDNSIKSDASLSDLYGNSLSKLATLLHSSLLDADDSKVSEILEVVAAKFGEEKKAFLIKEAMDSIKELSKLPSKKANDLYAEKFAEKIKNSEKLFSSSASMIMFYPKKD